ncbi:hypothetical protein AZE42_06544 [Rhizopogon vesiculosus]|uniref:Uncharacterized protein n=1 Tax=Rhizopogon vesiculosus TaxID=180088 RepID=A0A1J8Q407_9AGAM|nr:hypothetical protein AZE42_06544 [Rhizopogon vesiculosus]
MAMLIQARYIKKDCYKRRSAKQKPQLAGLRSRKTVEKQNAPPAKSCIGRERLQSSKRKRSSRKDLATVSLQQELKSLQASSAEDAAGVQNAKSDASWPSPNEDAVEAKLDAVVPRLTLEDVKKLRGPEIDLQIRWHRRFDTAVSAANTPPTKQKKVEVLMEAIRQFLRSESKTRARLLHHPS